jgi:hypothetical protein
MYCNLALHISGFLDMKAGAGRPTLAATPLGLARRMDFLIHRPNHRITNYHPPKDRHIDPGVVPHHYASMFERHEENMHRSDLEAVSAALLSLLN